MNRAAILTAVVLLTVLVVVIVMMKKKHKEELSTTGTQPSTDTTGSELDGDMPINEEPSEL